MTQEISNFMYNHFYICVSLFSVKPDLPLDLVADMDTLPILTTASHIRSYDQESLEDSLIGK